MSDEQDKDNKFSQEYVTELREEAKKHRQDKEKTAQVLLDLKTEFDKFKREAAEAGAAADGKKFEDLYDAAKVEIEGLKTKLSEAEKMSGSNDKLTETITGYLEAEIEEIPEDKRGSIPDLPLMEKLAWLKKAKTDGFFGDLKKKAPEHKGSGEEDDDEKNPWTKEHWNLTEQGKILKRDKSLADKFKTAAGKK